MIIRTKCLLWEKCSDDRIWPVVTVELMRPKQPLENDPYHPMTACGNVAQ